MCLPWISGARAARLAVVMQWRLVLAEPTVQDVQRCIHTRTSYSKGPGFDDLGQGCNEEDSGSVWIRRCVVDSSFCLYFLIPLSSPLHGRRWELCPVYRYVLHSKIGHLTETCRCMRAMPFSEWAPARPDGADAPGDAGIQISAKHRVLHGLDGRRILVMVCLCTEFGRTRA